MDIIQHSDLRFEIDDWKPFVPSDMREWFTDNDIIYEIEEDRYGSASFHYLLFLNFEKELDAVAFKLRWL